MVNRLISAGWTPVCVKSFLKLFTLKFKFAVNRLSLFPDTIG